MNNLFQTYNECLQHWAQETPNKIAYTFLTDGENLEEHITYQELNEKAKAIAATLQFIANPGDRVLLLYPSSIDFIAAFYGCLYAGVVAVPVFHKIKQSPKRLLAIMQDAQPTVALSNRHIITEAKEVLGDRFNSLKWQATDRVDARRAALWKETTVTPESLAFLQYTSGSTSTPKGVMVSQDNLLYQFEIIASGTSNSTDSKIFTWLPLYHDMGLIGNVLFNIFLGARCIFMTPTSFIKRPSRWLKAISKYQVDLSGAPNFAYDLVSRKTTEEEIATLDLSCWKVAFCGAEPIRFQTLQNFTQIVEPAGFNEKALFPCYGLAEATLMVTGTGIGNGVKHMDASTTDLEQGRANAASLEEGTTTLVGSGSKILEQEIRIVDPNTLKPLADGQVGEIWIAGRHVAKGYWEKPQASLDRLHARIEGEEHHYLRTGDLGFFQNGEIFITGRIKDLIKVRGRGIYPHDLEFAIEDLNAEWQEVRKGGSGVFAFEKDGQEQIAAFVEVNPKKNKNFNPSTLAKTIRETIASQFDVALADVVLIKSGTLPKTTSGKIRRFECRDIFMNDFKAYFPPIFRLQEEQPTQHTIIKTIKSPTAPVAKQKNNTLAKARIMAWVGEWMAKKLEFNMDNIDTTESLLNYGLDSLSALELVEDIEQKFKVQVSDTLVYDLRTIDAIVDHLAGSNCMAKAA